MRQKNEVICTLSSCVIWCVVMMPVVFPYLIKRCVWNEIKVSFSKHYDMSCLSLNEFFVN